jgi:transposase-like protein
MAAETNLDMSGWSHEQLEQASPDLLRSMVQAFDAALMGAQAEAICGAEFGARSPDRVNSRNGYWSRPWDTRADTIDLYVPKLRSGTYFAEWLLTRRSRAEAALITVVAASYVLGVSPYEMSPDAQQGAASSG